MTINIPVAVFEKYKEVCDYFLNSDQFSRACTLYYPPIKIPSDNHPYTTNGSIYQHGGPANQGGEPNPYSGGQGYKDQEVTDSIRLRIYWNKKKWISAGGVTVADADVQVIGFIADLPKLIACDSVELVTEQAQVRGTYKLLGTPFYHGFGKTNYFVAFLKRS